MKLAMTVTVKTMDTPRWICRIQLFQFNVTSFDDELTIPVPPESAGRGISTYAEIFDAASRRRERNEVRQVMACAASHHRLTWIHPFLV
jgi:hypothetical protein